jgi:hypothetical protein
MPFICRHRLTVGEEGQEAESRKGGEGRGAQWMSLNESSDTEG